MIIGIMGGGTTLAAVSGGRVSLTGLAAPLSPLVVMGYVFFGGMRGTAWVNTFQTILFLVSVRSPLLVIGCGHGRIPAASRRDAGVADGVRCSRANEISPLYFFSYTFIPFSSIAFPHISSSVSPPRG